MTINVSNLEFQGNVIKMLAEKLFAVILEIKKAVLRILNVYIDFAN
jgi:translation initiation factor IF-1